MTVEDIEKKMLLLYSAHRLLRQIFLTQKSSKWIVCLIGQCSFSIIAGCISKIFEGFMQKLLETPGY